MADEAPKDLIGFLDFYLVKKAPFQLPEGVKEAIVKFGPWVALVLIVLMLPFLLLVLGIGAFVLPFAAASGSAGAAAGFLTIPLVLVTLALDVAALPGLFARKMMGWKLIFYSRLITIVWDVLLLNILGAVIGGLIGLYILMQIRPLYNGAPAPARGPAGV
jgi:hypothetical protein